MASRREALSVFVWSRLAVWAGALYALVAFSGVHRDDPHVIHDLGRFTDVWGRWDSWWFIRIAHHGYDVAAGAPAFYPLYPGLVAVAGRVLGGHYLIGGLAISLAAAGASFVLLHRLASQLAGADVARRTVLFLAVFPMSLFLQAVYSESVFLLVALAAFLAAERRHFPLAGAFCGLALLARPTGAAVLLGVLLLARRAPRRALAEVVLPAVPLFCVFPLVLWVSGRSALAFLHVEPLWYRHASLAGPLDALQAAWTAVRTLTVGPHLEADHFAALNLEATAFFAAAVALGVVAWRRLGAPYGAMALASVVAPVFTPAVGQPLLSMPRFTLVAFPIFIALAQLASSRRAERAVVGSSAVLLGVATVQWALWQFVS